MKIDKKTPNYKISKIRKKKIQYKFNDFKNVDFLIDEIIDEMNWLEGTFLMFRTEWVTVWKNTNAEERFNKLGLRLESFHD